jgi:hypothetical protein
MQAVSEAEPSRELRRVIQAIHDLSELEAQIPLCKTIDEVEEIRGRTMGIQSYAREREDLGPALVAWAKRCAVLCQLRITEIQDLARRRKNGEISNVADFASRHEQNKRSDARLVASIPPEELEEQLKTSGSVQVIARKVRKARKKEPKTSPEARQAALDRYYRKKGEKQTNAPVAPKLGPKQKFERYWTQEQKLLKQFFAASDFQVIEDYWLKEFRSYRKEVEDGERERNEALAKLRTAATNGKDSAAAVKVQ